MYIFEEYANRIGYKIDFVRQHDAVVFIRSDNNFIIDVKRIFFENQPSKFRVELFFISKPKKVFDLDLEEYEIFINNNFKYKKNSITNPVEVYIFGWEFFLASNDSILEKNLSPNIIFPTINDSLENCKRIQNIDKLSNILQEEFPFIYAQWKPFRQYIENYSYWLAEIINS